MSLKSDEWYHEFGNAFCKLCNSSHIAIKWLKEGKPVQGIVEELESGIPHMATCNEIVQKVWNGERAMEIAALGSEKSSGVGPRHIRTQPGLKCCGNCEHRYYSRNDENYQCQNSDCVDDTDICDDFEFEKPESS